MGKKSRFRKGNEVGRYFTSGKILCKSAKKIQVVGYNL
jgi:hypothetical protein